MNFQSILPYLVARLGETSTWRGFIYLLTACGVVLSPDQQTAVLSAGLAFAGLLSVFFPDKKAPKE